MKSIKYSSIKPRNLLAFLAAELRNLIGDVDFAFVSLTCSDKIQVP